MANRITQNAAGMSIERDVPLIYQLIGKAIGMISAIGKDRVSKDRSGAEQFKYRGIDQVYNALNPVLAELGIFFCPEVIDQKREERTTRNGAMLVYTILTIRFTAYAPDGSSVSMTVIGEGMDSGDKSSNKAMSVAMKYAMFQLFCIPTEEMKDPDADVYTDVMPRNAPATMTTQATVPPPVAKSVPQEEQKPETPAAYIKRRIGEFKSQRADFDFKKSRAALIESGIVEDIPSAIMKMDQAVALMDAIDKNFMQKAG